MEPLDIYAGIQPLIKKEINDSIKEHKEDSKFKVEDIPAHTHNGVDSNQIDFSDLASNSLYIPFNLFGTSAATATNYGVIFIAPFPCSVYSVKESHQTAGTDGGAVTLSIEKLTGTQALNSGVEIMTPLSLKGTKDMVVNGVLSDVISNVNMATGDRLALKDTGTLTSVAGISLMITIKF